MARINLLAGAFALSLLTGTTAHGQAIDLAHGGPVTVTAAGGIDWDQGNQTVTAHDDARAVRGNATITADRLVAHYRKKAAAPGKPGASPGASPAAPVTPVAAPAGSAAGPPTPAPAGKAPPADATGASPAAAGDTGNNEIYRLNAFGKVHIFTQTDQAWGDEAVYDIDQAVLVLTGHGLRLTTPQDVLTARDAMEYWSDRHLAVARGDASATSADGRRITADTLVGYTAPAQPAAGAAKPPAKPDANAKNDANAKSGDPIAGGKLQRVEAYGHVKVRTATDIVTGDRGVYLPDTGLARVLGNVHITRGENQLNGAAAIVNMKTGLATLTQTPGGRVQGLVVPNGSGGSAAPGGTPERKGKS